MKAKRLSILLLVAAAALSGCAGGSGAALQLPQGAGLFETVISAVAQNGTPDGDFAPVQPRCTTAEALPGPTHAQDRSGQPMETLQNAKAAEPGSWAIYWYLCGTDLESGYGLASMDLQEMFSVALPENVTVVVQTGGAAQWAMPGIEGDALGRYEYRGDTWTHLQSLPNASMGDPETLADFLRFCHYYYPAEHTMLLFWGHGGGMLGGVGYDENYGYDSLTIGEINQAMSTDARRVKPYDLIGLDSCMMADLETLLSIGCGGAAARYVVASQSLESGFGWDYAAWLGALATDPTMDAPALGKTICDTYMDACVALGVQDQATLSVLDPRAAVYLSSALNDLLAPELFSAIAEGYLEPEDFRRAARRVMYFGENNPYYGYSETADLSGLADAVGRFATQETYQLVRGYLDATVSYRVGGPNTVGAAGISALYPYSGALPNGYENYGVGYAYLWLMGYVSNGTLDGRALDYVQALPDALQAQRDQCDRLRQQGAFCFQDGPDGMPGLCIDPELLGSVQAISYQYVYLRQDLGQDNTILWNMPAPAADPGWQSGAFTCPLNFIWRLNGHPVYVEVLDQGPGGSHYKTYLMVNGEPWEVIFYHDPLSQSVALGQGRLLNQDGTFRPTSRWFALNKGDTVTPLFYEGGIDLAPGEGALCAGEPFTYDGSFELALSADAPAGHYQISATVTDVLGRQFSSNILYLDFSGEGGAQYWYDRPGYELLLWEEPAQPEPDVYRYEYGGEGDQDASGGPPCIPCSWQKLGYLTEEEEQAARQRLLAGEIAPWQYFRYRDPALFDEAIRYLRQGIFYDSSPVYLYEEHMASESWRTDYGFASKQEYNDFCEAAIAQFAAGQAAKSEQQLQEETEMGIVMYPGQMLEDRACEWQQR